MSWECIVADGTKWRSAVKQHLKTEEDVISATKTVTPALSLQPQSMLLHPCKKLIKLKPTKHIMPRMNHSLSSLIDGGIYFLFHERIY